MTEALRSVLLNWRTVLQAAVFCGLFLGLVVMLGRTQDTAGALRELRYLVRGIEQQAATAAIKAEETAKITQGNRAILEEQQETLDHHAHLSQQAKVLFEHTLPHFQDLVKRLTLVVENQDKILGTFREVLTRHTILATENQQFFAILEEFRVIFARVEQAQATVAGHQQTFLEAVATFTATLERVEATLQRLEEAGQPREPPRPQ